MNPSAVAIAAAIAIAGVLAGAGGAHLYYAPRLALAQERTDALGERVREQNRAVEAMAADGERRKAEAAAAKAAASKAAQAHTKRAAELEALPVPAGEDCAAIDALLTKGLGR